jgi:oxygen-independent coproporphyrinogen-3 oxidase
MIQSLIKELEIRNKEPENSNIKTLYLGGGTPSILNIQELVLIFDKVKENYNLSELEEITLEANPDDLTPEFLQNLKIQTPVNRLSIGIQSFFNEDLRLMNRAHNAEQAENCIKNAQKFGFKNISIDLIYGSQATTDEHWKSNLEKTLEMDIPHVSAYALTVEPKTAFEHQIRKGKIAPVDEEKQWKQFEILRDTLTKNGFVQYEFSNFGKEGFFSQHNISYWKNQAYLGVGPSAHSFDGKSQRSWNVANNIKYINALEKYELPSEKEILSEKEAYNEYIMLGLRTMWGICIAEIEQRFSEKFVRYFHRELENLEKENLVLINNEIITIHPECLFRTDGIISRLFFVD